MYLSYNIYKSNARDINISVKELLEKIPEDKIPVRLVFFGMVLDNLDYLNKRNAVLMEVDAFFNLRRPLVSFVAQAPVDASLYLEAHLIDKNLVQYISLKSCRDTLYAILAIDDNKFLFTEGILPSDLDMPIKNQALEVFCKLDEILSLEKIPISCIDRQWNYIENIVGEKNPGLQNYQQLNDARSIFYSKTEWEHGYPSATGIGTQAGGIMVEVNAAVMNNMRRVPIDNSLQVAAHAYSSEVLIGNTQSKTTPKFERAKAVVNIDNDCMVYVSGTAAIRGEESLFGVGIEKQTVITIENIEHLITDKTLKENNIVLDKDVIVTNFRVYLKYAGDIDIAKKVISSRFPNIQVLYVLSDVCRDELLIEIEAIAKKIN